MSGAGYTPRKDSTAVRAIEFMKTQPAGTPFTPGELAEGIGAAKAGMATQLRKAIDAGLVLAGRAGNQSTYSLPVEPEPGDGSIGITTYDDGDVQVTGLSQTDEGVMFTREQLQQLVTHVITPHVVLPARSQA